MKHRPIAFLLVAAAFGGLQTAHAHQDHPAPAADAVHAHDHASSIGEAGTPAGVARTVNVDMTDGMRFTPASIDVKQGQTIRFVVKNSGQLKHEFVLGTAHELKEHYEQMKKFPEMEHSDANQVSVQPGQTGEVIWRFAQAGEVQFACLQPGHYDAGMKGQVQVLPAGDAMADGEVRKIDRENGKLTLKHGELRSLGMPGMTMVFKVQDPSVLDKLQPGDKVRFTAERTGGAITVTQIEQVK